MENKTTQAEMFYALQQGLKEVANSITQLSKVIIAGFVLNLCTLGLMLYGWITHPTIAPIAAALLATTTAAVIWCWFALPEDLSELFEHIDVPKLSEK